MISYKNLDGIRKENINFKVKNSSMIKIQQKISMMTSQQKQNQHLRKMIKNKRLKF
jgi:hypothetical protein